MTAIPTTTPAASVGEFRVGLVFRRSFSILFQNFVSFMLLSGLASLPFLFIYGSLYGGFQTQLTVRRTENQISVMWDGKQIGLFVLGFALTELCQAVVLYGAFQAMRGQPLPMLDSIRKGFARLIPVVATVVCLVVCVFLGGILFVVPALILMSMFYVALPACVVEQLGPFRSLGRSRELTKGHRWKIFGIAILLIVALEVLGYIVAMVLAIPGNSIVLVLGVFLWSTFVRAAESVVPVVVYHDLRVGKEGVDIARIASVFD